MKRCWRESVFWMAPEEPFAFLGWGPGFAHWQLSLYDFCIWQQAIAAFRETLLELGPWQANISKLHTPNHSPLGLSFFNDPKMMLRRWSGWAGEWWNLVMFQEKHSSTMWVRDGQYKTEKKIHKSCSSLSSRHLGQGLTQTCSTKLVTNIMPILAQSPPQPGNQNMWWPPERWPWTNTPFVLCEQQWLEDKESLQ